MNGDGLAHIWRQVICNQTMTQTASCLSGVPIAIDISCQFKWSWSYIDVLGQERRNSSVLAMELRLSCTKPSMYNLINMSGTSVISQCRIYASVNWVIIGSGNTLSPCRRQAIKSLRPGDAYMRQWTSHYCFRQWLVAWPAPSHYLNQCWNIVYWTLRNKLRWNVNRNSYIFIQENAFQNVVWKMAAILSRSQCVNWKNWLIVN